MFTLPAYIALVFALLACLALALAIKLDCIKWAMVAVLLTVLFAGYTSGLIAHSIF